LWRARETNPTHVACKATSPALVHGPPYLAVPNGIEPSSSRRQRVIHPTYPRTVSSSLYQQGTKKFGGL